MPYPVSHGGFYDLFYKIVALHQQGVQIVLHCFEYGRGKQEILNHYCSSVHYYKRKKGIAGLSITLPYIVSSRCSKILLQNLSADNDPILLEGTHCTYLLYKNFFPQRTILYRLHNIEHIYYKHLLVTERSVFKKLYYKWESILLERYEKKVAPKATIVLTVTTSDATLFKRYCPSAQVQYLPVFLPQIKPKANEGIGSYCLYQGNLSIAENEEACRFLIESVFRQLNYPLIIAGRKPSAYLKKLVAQQQNIKLIPDPTEKEMKELIQNAQINLIVSFNGTGIKLKLINALVNGRHCIGNNAAIAGTGIEECCTLANTPHDFKEAILKLKDNPLQSVEKANRYSLLSTIFDAEKNAQKLIELLY